MDTSPGPASQIKIGERTPVSEVEQHSRAVEQGVFELRGRRPGVCSELKMSRLVVACSAAEVAASTVRYLNKGGAPLEYPTNPDRWSAIDRSRVMFRVGT